MLNEVINLLADAAISLIETLKYWGIFIGMAIESACIPLPSEVIMLFGGFLVGIGKFEYWYVVWAGVLGNVVGSVLTYWVGASGGRTFLIKYGKYFLINTKHLEHADKWFERFGGWAVFLGRNLPVVRTFISLPAGIARMNFWTFFILSFLGCIPWNMGLTYLGLKLGEHWHTVEQYIRPVSYAIVILVIIFVCYFIYKNVTQNKQPKEARK